MNLRSVLICAMMIAATPGWAQDRASDEYPLHTLDEVVVLVAQRPAGVKVTVDFPIAKVEFGKKGRGAGHVFLDSMQDYRDPRSINVNVFPNSAQRLKLTPDAQLAGKTLTVHGVAARVLIRCHAGCPQDSSAHHYFQTQIFVREGGDAQIEESEGE